MLEPQGKYVLIKKYKEKDVTDGGVILTDNVKKKKESNRPTGQLVGVGPTVTSTFLLNDYVLFDPVKCHAVFDYKGDQYIVASDDAILLKIDDPKAID